VPHSLSTLQPGHRFGPYDVTLSPEHGALYAAAVGGEGTPVYAGALPPLAVIAAGLSRLIAELGMGAGTVHAGQEVEFLRPVKPGEKVLAFAELKANSLRKDVRFATISTEFRDINGGLVATSSSTVMVPA
jgi:acyl dehydratase